MKAALLKGPGEVILEEVPVPEISDDEVMVEVQCCGICGTDIHAIVDCALLPAGTYMGHEFSGVVAKVGRNIKEWKPGDRVVCNELYECGKCYACKHGIPSCCIHLMEQTIGDSPGLEYAGAFAKYVRVPYPEYRLYALPNEVSFEEGVLVEPLACSLHAVRMSMFKPRDKVMVLGCGMIGLGVIAFLKNAGAGLIIATETIEKRVEIAEKLGADYLFNPQKVSYLKERVFELTNGGVDVVFDCSGQPQAFQSATSFLRPGGQVLLVGIIPHEVPIIPLHFVLGEYNLQASMCYYAFDEFPMVIEFLKRRLLPVKEIITSKINLSDIVTKGFDVLARPDHNEIKIIVQPDE